MGQLDYGIFNEFWNGYPNHLPFLNFIEGDENSEWNLTKSMERLDLICDQNSSDLILEGILKMIKSENWRPHLIAILAALKLTNDSQQKLIYIFWKRLAKGSWISPQIVSVLFIIDNEFESKAKRILQKGFQVIFSPMDAMQHHSARGPEGSAGASQKVMDSIKSLLETNNDDFGWKEGLMYYIENEKFKVNTKR